MHFVVITGQNGGTYDINDPWNGDQKTLSSGDLGSYTVDALRYFTGSGSGGGSCAGPSLSSPSNGATLTSETITFSWSGPSGCSFSGYTFRVRLDSNFDDPNGNHIIDTGIGGTSTTQTITGHDNQTLYWAVRAANAPNGASWSSYRTFTISPAISCSGPSLSSPSNGATLTSETITFSWNGPSGCTYSGYTFRVRLDSNFDDPNGNHIIDTGIGGTSTTQTITGHDNQTLYWAVRAANAPNGASWSSYQTFVISPSVPPPDAPGNPSATAINSTQIQLSWTYASGAAGYRIKRWDGVSSWPVLVDNLNSGYNSYTDGNLTPGATYWYYICAFNSSGETCITNWVTATLPVSAPSAPGNVTATGISSSQIQLSWSSASGATGYRVMRTDGHDSWPWPVIADNLGSGTTSYTDGGLSPNSTYFYYVCAFNSGGETCNSPYVSGTTQPAVTVPIAPTSSSAVALSTSSIRFAWFDNSNNEDGFYVYRWSVPDGQQWVLVYTTGANATVFTDSGLQPGTTYWYDACSFNSAGASCGTTSVSATTLLPWSVTLQATATTIMIGAPVILTAVANQDVGPTPYYLVILASDNSVVASCGSGTTCTATVTSATATSQTYHAVVGTSSGASPQATSGTVTVTWAPLPGKPTGVTGTRGDASVQVSWTAPADNGSPITSFTVTSSPGARTCTTPNGSTTTCTVSGLTNGTSYTFTVTATNGVGTGLASDPSSAVTPATVPGKPTGVHAAAAGNGSASVSWTAPGSTGGSPISTYLVTSTPGSFQCVASGSSCTVTGLTNGQAYTFTVTANNGVGAGPASDPFAAVTPPGATYHPVTPNRLVDSRSGAGQTGLSAALAYNTPVSFVVTDRNSGNSSKNIPANAIAVTGNLTVTDQTAMGYFSLTPTQPTGVPGTSTLNFPTGDNRANAVTVPLGSDGAGHGVIWITYEAVSNSATADVVFDVTGYFVNDSSGATYHPVTPNRLVDSRSGAGQTGLSAALAYNTPVSFIVTDRNSGDSSKNIPANAIAVTGNLTVTEQTAMGYFSLTPTQPSGVPSTSTLNFPTGDNRANAVTVPLGSDGSGHGVIWITYEAVSNSATAHVVFDVTGYFVNDSSGAYYVPVTPNRLVDSRSGAGQTGLSSSLSHNTPASFIVTGRVPGDATHNVPANAVAVTGNLTVTNQTSFGYLSLTPSAPSGVPSTSTLNFPTGDNRANAVVVPLGSDGAGHGVIWVTYEAVSNTATTDVVFDVSGYFVE
jgi:hypothetical protein